VRGGHDVTRKEERDVISLKKRGGEKDTSLHSDRNGLKDQHGRKKRGGEEKGVTNREGSTFSP